MTTPLSQRVPSDSLLMPSRSADPLIFREVGGVDMLAAAGVVQPVHRHVAICRNLPAHAFVVPPGVDQVSAFLAIDGIHVVAVVRIVQSVDACAIIPAAYRTERGPFVAPSCRDQLHALRVGRGVVVKSAVPVVHAVHGGVVAGDDGRWLPVLTGI